MSLLKKIFTTLLLIYDYLSEFHSIWTCAYHVLPFLYTDLRKKLDNGLSAEINGVEYNGVLSDTIRAPVINIQVLGPLPLTPV